MKTQEKNKSIKRKGKIKKIWNGVPATVKQTLFEKTLSESVFASLFFHIAGIFLIWLITFALFFFGIAPKIFPRPKQKTPDIEFNLNNSKSYAKRSSSSGPAKTIQPVSEALPPKTKEVLTHNNKMSNPSAKIPAKTQTSDFDIPMPNFKSLSSGLKTARKTSGGSSNSASQSGVTGHGFDEFASDNAASGGGGGGGFNKSATKKIVTVYDISPYVNELRRNVQWHWKTPAGGENKRVELFLRIARDGRLVILNVKRTSENADADNAALNAVRKCQPLNPLPDKYTKNYLDVIFTFGGSSVASRY